MKTLHALFHGKVQNVGFRATIRRYALHYSIKGYVANKSDGSVELIAQGPDDIVDKFLASIQEYPRGARIKECIVNPVDNKETFQNFVIRHEHP